MEELNTIVEAPEIVTDVNKQMEIDKEKLIEKKKEALKQLPNYRGEVQSRNNIRQLPNTKVNDIYWVEMDKKPYVVAAKDKQKITIKALDENASISTGMTIYDLNHNIVAKESLFDWNNEEAVKELDEKVQKWFEEEVKDNQYFLFYGRDIHYLTLFKRSGNPVNLLENIKESIEEFAELISIDLNTTEDKEKKLEIWVRTPYNDAELLYFFPYDAGISEL